MTVQEAIGVRRYSDGTKMRVVYQFKCAHCGGDIWKRKGQIPTMTGLCRACACARPNVRTRKRPYEWCFNNLLRSAEIRSIPVDLTYEEFVEFTAVRSCHYCEAPIDWRPFGRHYTTSGQSKGSNLDRIDNLAGYRKDNLVVACKVCNRIKNNHLTYEEMRQLAPHLRAIRCNREGQKWQ